MGGVMGVALIGRVTHPNNCAGTRSQQLEPANKVLVPEEHEQQNNTTLEIHYIRNTLQ